MASLLRSSKFVRYFVSFARNIVINHPRDVDGTLVQKSQILATCVQKDYGTLVAPARENKGWDIDRSIKRLDEDVRRTGRVSRNELQGVINEIRNHRHATSTQSLMVIRCCGNLVPEEVPEVRTKLVKDVWKTFENIGVVMDISHYNALLRVYLENEHTFSPSEFLADLEMKGVEPNRVTFQRLIAAYCQQGDIEGATRILEFMKEKQMPVNESVFNALIMGHSNADDMESASGIMGLMKQANIEPSTDTYLALICGYAKRGNMDSIKSVIKESEAAGVNFGDRDFLEIVYSLAVNGHLNLLDEVLDKLPKLFGFNQDAKNVALRLIARGEDKAAIKILKSMNPINGPNGEPVPVGNFLLKQMVKANRPFETIISLCKELQNEKANEKALVVATEASLIYKNVELSLLLLGALAKQEPVCQHYYWPIIVEYGKQKNKQGILKVLRQMGADTKQPISGETLREYVVQHMSEGEAGIQEMRQAGVSPASAAAATLVHILQNSKNLKFAARIGLNYRANYNSLPLRRALVNAFLTDKDIESFVTLVKLIEQNNAPVEEDEEGTEPSGKILLGLAGALRSDRSVVLTQVLQKYLEHGIGISNSIAESLQEKLSGDELTPEISSLLTKLTSTELISTELQRPVPSRIMRMKDPTALLNTIAATEAKGESAEGLKRQLLTSYCHNRDLEKAEGLIKELETTGFEFQTGTLSLVMDLYCFHDKLPEAMEYYKKVHNIDPNAPIDESKIVRLATLLTKNDRLPEAMEIFKNHKQGETAPERGFGYSSACWKLLNSVAEKGDVDVLNELFNVMRDSHFIQPNNVLLGPLIKVHLMKDDIKGALDKFEECCTKYNATPWKNEIACKLIQNEDAVSLQRLTDLSTRVHGEVNSLYDLVLSFVECGRIRQARKILETPGLRIRSQRINSACERYVNEGLVNHLEGLIKATKDLPHIDRADIYQHLVSSYSKSDEVDKALSLWTQMQDEDVRPTDEFLLTLAELLRKHNRSVPFSVPEVKKSPVISVSEEKDLALKKKSLTVQTQIKALRRAIYSHDIDEALKIYETLNDSDLQVVDRSSLLIFLVNNGRIGEASRLLVRWLENGHRPNIKSMNFLINNIAKVGDIDSFNSIGKLLDENTRKMVSFINRQTHCMVEAGRVKEVLNIMESEIDKANTEEEITAVQLGFPRGGAFSILQTNEDELVSEFERIAGKYQKKGLLEPFNVLWAHYLVEGKREKAETFWPYLKSSPRLMFQSVMRKIRDTKDLELGEYLCEICKKSAVNSGAIGIAYSAVLDVLILQGQIEVCNAKLEEALQHCKLEDISTNTLVSLKKAMENNQLTFKYSIPPRRSNAGAVSSSSSSSDSDTEGSANKMDQSKTS